MVLLKINGLPSNKKSGLAPKKMGAPLRKKAWSPPEKKWVVLLRLKGHQHKHQSKVLECFCWCSRSI